MSVSFEATLGDEIRRAAREGGVGLSSWLAEAAARKLRADALREFLDEWEAEFGAVTPEELAQAEADLGLGAGEPEARAHWCSTPVRSWRWNATTER